MNKLSCLAVALLCAAAPSFAATEGFPSDATLPRASELASRLTGKAFVAKTKNGELGRHEFNDMGSFVVANGNGQRAIGNWRAEDGKFCSRVKGRERNLRCSDARIHQDRLLVRANKGELITFEPR
ncbi:hypothetical protein [Piscinibacter sakaiensis]|uniref:hypothetical protein n=1 Tax=Piscinibacter sakaiensis TaxID=1547922 RepID=UPI003AAF6545